MKRTMKICFVGFELKKNTLFPLRKYGIHPIYYPKHNWYPKKIITANFRGWNMMAERLIRKEVRSNQIIVEQNR